MKQPEWEGSGTTGSKTASKWDAMHAATGTGRLRDQARSRNGSHCYISAKLIISTRENISILLL